MSLKSTLDDKIRASFRRNLIENGEDPTVERVEQLVKTLKWLQPAPPYRGIDECA